MENYLDRKATQTSLQETDAASYFPGIYSSKTDATAWRAELKDTPALAPLNAGKELLKSKSQQSAAPELPALVFSSIYADMPGEPKSRTKPEVTNGEKAKDQGIDKRTYNLILEKLEDAEMLHPQMQEKLIESIQKNPLLVLGDLSDTRQKCPRNYQGGDFYKLALAAAFMERVLGTDKNARHWTGSEMDQILLSKQKSNLLPNGEISSRKHNRLLNEVMSGVMDREQLSILEEASRINPVPVIQALISAQRESQKTAEAKRPPLSPAESELLAELLYPFFKNRSFGHTADKTKNDDYCLYNDKAADQAAKQAEPNAPASKKELFTPAEKQVIADFMWNLKHPAPPKPEATLSPEDTTLLRELIAAREKFRITGKVKDQNIMDYINNADSFLLKSSGTSLLQLLLTDKALTAERREYLQMISKGIDSIEKKPALDPREVLCVLEKLQKGESVSITPEMADRLKFINDEMQRNSYYNRLRTDPVFYAAEKARWEAAVKALEAEKKAAEEAEKKALEDAPKESADGAADSQGGGNDPDDSGDGSADDSSGGSYTGSAADKSGEIPDTGSSSAGDNQQGYDPYSVTEVLKSFVTPYKPFSLGDTPAPTTTFSFIDDAPSNSPTQTQSDGTASAAAPAAPKGSRPDLFKMFLFGKHLEKTATIKAITDSGNNSQKQDADKNTR